MVLCNKSPIKGDKGYDPGGLQHPKRLLCLGKPDWLYAGSQHFGQPTIRPLIGPFSINPRKKCKDHSHSQPGPRCLGRTSRVQAREVPIHLLEVIEPLQGSWRSWTVVYVLSRESSLFLLALVAVCAWARLLPRTPFSSSLPLSSSSSGRLLLLFLLCCCCFLLLLLLQTASSLPL